MSTKIDFLHSHGSVRRFTEREISREDELEICTLAQRSPTSSNLQTYSIISVRNPETKTTLARLCGDQDHVACCPLFLVCCADMQRLAELNQERGYPCHADTTEMFIVATVDTALAAGRALMAAQALGMGGVMVGAIRINSDEVSALLGLPDLVYPVMGMSLGYPVKPPTVKPRLPLDAVRFEETYQSEPIAAAVEEYDRTLSDLDYLRGREVEPERYPDFKGAYSWSEHSARRLASDTPSTLRLHLRDYLQSRGFMKR